MLVKFIKILLIVLIYIVPEHFSQIDPRIQRYRDDEIGISTARSDDTLNANNVSTLFYNTGLIGKWPQTPSFVWPNNGSDHRYSDGMAMVITAKVVAPGNNNIIHPLQTYYYEYMDRDPATSTSWGFEPVPGYANENLISPAINSDPTSWPTVWPAALNLSTDWDGHWYGYFGKDVFYPNQETFFVMDDAQDKEWTRPPYSYWPIVGNNTRGGLGLRIEVRQFQWNHTVLNNTIFIHYDITNISDYDYDSVFVGFYNNLGIGGLSDQSDDNANYDKQLDIAYGFDMNGAGLSPNWTTGDLGIAFLETPSNGSNGIDDDEDGMIDERKDDGIDNDGDWRSFSDLNSNGIWDTGEPQNDDVGMDGVPNTNDLGEVNGMPNFGEPNFDMTDKDEADQIGLTSFRTIRHNGSDYGFPQNDQSYWEIFTSGFDTNVQNTNISIITGSGAFPLGKGTTIRLAAAITFGYNLEKLLYNKMIAQTFYNKNYSYSSIYNASTSIMNAVLAGSQSLDVQNTEGFSIGDEIIINPGGDTEETNIITGFGSILLQDSLQYNHEVGELIAKLITTGLSVTENKQVTNYKLLQNFPNPFNPTTTIKFEVPKTSQVKLKVYDILGREIASLINEELVTGSYELVFDASEISSGVYFYQLRSGDYIVTKKMILIK